jgi:hypothetical protein
MLLYKANAKGPSDFQSAPAHAAAIATATATTIAHAIPIATGHVPVFLLLLLRCYCDSQPSPGSSPPTRVQPRFQASSPRIGDQHRLQPLAASFPPKRGPQRFTDAGKPCCLREIMNMREGRKEEGKDVRKGAGAGACMYVGYKAIRPLAHG